MIHELKVVPPYFDHLADGSKTFEVRKDDRGYQRGDTLRLREWTPKCRNLCPDKECRHRYTGREMTRQVGFIFKAGFGCDLGEHVVLSLLPAPSADRHTTSGPTPSEGNES